MNQSDTLFQGPGEMATRCRDLDWSPTGLGPPTGWPQSLRMAAQLVLASAFPTIVLWGVDLIQIYNDKYRYLMGNKHPEGLGQPTQQCWPEVWHINQPIYQRVWAGESVAFENALYPITRSGRLEDAWFTLAYSPVWDASGQVEGILVTVVETTSRMLEEKHRQQVQEALHQQQQRQAFLLRLSDVLRPLVDASAIRARVTGSAMDYFGTDRCYYGEIIESNALIQQDASQAGLPSVAGIYPLSSFPLLQSVIDTGRPFVVDDVHTTDLVDEPLRQLCIDLQVISFLDVPVVKNGQPVGVLCITQSTPRHWDQADVQLAQEIAERTWMAVERARTETALQASEERFRLFVTASSDVVYTMSADWRQMNQLDGKTFLADTREPSRDWLLKYIPADDQLRVEIAIDKAIATKQVFELEHRIIQADGQLGWTYSRAVPILDGQGQILEWFGTASDVTERKQAEEALRDADRRKREFLALLSHELRNPLAPIRGGLQVLSLTNQTDPTLSTLLPVMSRQMDHVIRMLDDLLDMSRLSRGKLELRQQPVDLTEVVTQAVDALRLAYETAGRQLHLALPTGALWLSGDATRLHQVVTNLLTNGLRYTRESGQVWLRLEAVGSEAVLRVRDNGIGLAGEQLTAIFELFVQVDTALARPNSGLGIGLSLVQQLVSLHGGRVEAFSPGLELGSEFVIHLPFLAS